MQKAVTYIRVSSTEQKETGYSPDAQKRLLWGFARTNGLEVVEDFEDAETAGKVGRTNFLRMIDFVRKSGIKFILVEKTDRLTRNFKDYGMIEDLMRDCDVTVHLVKEASSISKDSSSNQKFMFGIKTLMAKNFLDNLSEETVKGMNEKVATGEYPSKAPLGYLNAQDPITKKNVIIVDEKNRQLIKALFELYATGNHSLLSLITAIEKMGLTSSLPTGRTFNKTTTAKILKSPFYIGHFMWRGKEHKGNHEPIVDPDVWQKVQDVMGGKRTNSSKKHNNIPFAFKGIMTCGECGRTITYYMKKGHLVYCRCTKYQTSCSQRQVKEEMLLDAVKAHLKPMETLSNDGVDFVAAGLKESLQEKRQWYDTAYEGMVEEKTRLKNRLDKMYEDYLDRKIATQYYEQKAKEYSARIEDLESKIGKHDRVDINYYDFGHHILELAKNAKKLFELATPTEKQELLRFLLSNSTLKDEKPEFALKSPFFEIAKRSPLRERSAWGG